MRNIMKIPQRSKWRNAIWSRKSILGYMLIWRKQNTNSKRYMQIYVHCSLKKKENLPFAPTWLDMESIMLIEISQRQILYDFNHMWNLRNKRKGKKREVAQWCLTLCDPMDCSLPGSSIHGIFQARVLEWVAISFSRGSSRPRDQTWVSRTVGRHFTVWATWKVQVAKQMSKHN